MVADLSDDIAELNLTRCSLGGPLPPALGRLTNLTSLLLYNNAHSGELPVEVFQFSFYSASIPF